MTSFEGRAVAPGLFATHDKFTKCSANTACKVDI